MHSITSHQVAVKNPENGFVSDDEKVVLLPLQLENDRLKTNGKIMVRLVLVSSNCCTNSNCTYLCPGISVMIWIGLVLLDLLWVKTSDGTLG